MVASFATRTVANFRLPRLIDDSKRARPRIRCTRRVPVRNLLVHFPARGRRYPSSREGPREVSAREVRAPGRRQDAHASSSRSLVPPTHAHAREIDRPRREKRGGNITLVTRIYTMNTFELKAETKAPPQRFDSFNGLRRSGSGAIVSGAPREIPVRSTFARGDESTPTAICLPPSRKRTRKTHVSIFPRVRRGFDPRRVARNPLAPSPEARQIRYSITTRRCRLSDTPKAVSHPTVPL